MNTEDNNLQNTPGITVRGIDEIVEEKLEGLDAVSEEIAKQKEIFYSSLAGHIRSAFQTNKNARRESDIENEMTDSLFQVNMQYRDHELSSITSGSRIYMGITATKSRAARHWIRDLVQPANEVPFKISHSPSQDLPPEILEQVEEAFEADRERLAMDIEKEFAEQQKMANPEPKPELNRAAQPQGAPPEMGGQPGPEGMPPQGKPPEQPPQEQVPPGMLLASKKLRAEAELRRDIEEAILGEIRKIAQNDVEKIQTLVVDSLLEGDWQLALSDFIEDFTIYPTAFMKGPIVTTRKKLVWKNGVAVPERKVVFLNKRVSPYDIYPSPSAVSIYDGNFLEHIRFTSKDLSDLTFLGPETGYKKRAIIKVLEEITPGMSSDWYDGEIEEDKQEAEKRGSQTHASEGIYHGVHFWGTASVKMLKEWGYEDDELEGLADYNEVEIEAIMVGNEVIKCIINRDPLGRRPYYSASFQTRSGSIWGKSLPAMMRDIQSMCNACARSLADNMGLSSGPQVAIMVDRLADDGDITEMEPRMIWQFTSDPTGNSGKPIEFFVVPSNANELLAVYDKFELKADDVTGVPRYAYGNENVGGAAQTAKGLSMLLESASKGIKGSIKNMSEGVIIPRVTYEFYLTLLKAMEDGNPINFNGDINVVVHAVEALTIKAAEMELQREILQATANPIDMEIVGMTGRGDVLRKVYKGANLPEDAVPSRLELKEKEARKRFEGQKAQQMAQQEGQAKRSASVEATTVQAEANKEIAAQNREIKAAELEMKHQHKQGDQTLKAAEIESNMKANQDKAAAKMLETDKKLAAQSQDTDRKLAVDLHKSKRQGDISAEEQA